MSQILNKVRDVDANNSDAVKDVLSAFFSNLTKESSVDPNRWLRALENIITRFPRFCGAHRNTIETFLSSFISSSNYYHVIEAAKCAHALQQVRPPQEKNATAKSCWREHLAMLCNAAHKLVGAMFPNSVDIYERSSQKIQVQPSTSPLSKALEQVLSLPKTQNNNVNKQMLLKIRLRNVLVFLQAALVEVYPVAKPVQPQLIMEVIVRALSVSSGVKNPSDIAKAGEIKVQALRTLDALIACLGSNLIPYSGLIFKFVILTLKWTADNNSEETREARCTAYGSLRLWLRSLRSHRLEEARGRAWEDELARHVVADVTPTRHLVQLTMRACSTQNMSKRAKRKKTNNMLEQSGIGNKNNENNNSNMSQEANDEIAIAALDFAEAFIDVCGIFLKNTTHQLLQEHVVRLCFNMEEFPRDSLRARGRGLLRVLLALRRSAPPGAPPPAHCCLRLYSDLAGSADAEISKFCSQALLDMRLHLHCGPPSLNYVRAPPPRESPAPKLSSRNRVALNNLLGPDRVPKQKLPPAEDSGDVIDLEDAPSKKRARIEPDDQISVSSGSSDDEVEEVSCDVVESESDNEDDDVVDGGETSTQAQKKSISSEGVQIIDDDDDEDSRASRSNNDSQDASSNDDTGDTRSKDESRDAASNESQDSSKEHSQDAADNTNSQDAASKDDSRDTEFTNESRDVRRIERSHDTMSKDDSQETTSNDDSQDTQSTAEDVTDRGETSKTNSDYNVSASQDQSKGTQGSDIHEMKTQMAINVSGESAEEPRSPRSMEVEVAYDLTQSNAGSKVVIIEKIAEDDHLPSTNDTDDAPITCGQVIKSSQEIDIEKSKEVENKENEVPKVNGDNNNDKVAGAVTDKNTGSKDVSVDDMLADFVDEVIEENKT